MTTARRVVLVFQVGSFYHEWSWRPRMVRSRICAHRTPSGAAGWGLHTIRTFYAFGPFHLHIESRKDGE